MDTMGKSHGQFAIIPARALDDTRFDDNERHLRALLVLGTYADRDGWCYPSLGTIADRLSVSRPTVSTTMHDLAEWGYILIVHRYGEDGEGNKSNQYRIIHDAELPVKFARENEKHPVKSASTAKKHPVKNSLAEVVHNDPINDPINVSAETAPTSDAIEYIQSLSSRTIKQPSADEEFDALPSASASAPTMSAAAQEFFKQFSRKRWGTPAERELFEETERTVGGERMLNAVRWAAENRIARVPAICTAARNGGAKKKSGNGNGRESKLDQLKRVLGVDNGNGISDCPNDDNVFDGISVAVAE